jgi:HK97 family phage major capsid protein
MTELVAECCTYVVIISERMNMSIEVNEALEAIKAQVEEKFAGVAVKADVDASIEAKADKAEIGELKGALETLEAKFDAMPAPALIKATPEEIQIMNSVNEGFAKSVEATGKAHLDVEIKGITEGRNVTGGKVETFGLIGSMFDGNPIRQLASVMNTTSKAIDLPVRAGAHNAQNAGATKLVAETSTASVGVTQLIVQTYNARADVTIEAVNDIPGFDQFWAQDMLAEVASVEAAAHVTELETMDAGKVAAATDEVTWAEIVDLYYALSPVARVGGSFMFASEIMNQLRTLSNSGTGSELLFDPELGGFRLFGRPVFENPYMAAPVANAVTGAYGDFKKGLVIGQRAQASIGRYDQTVPGKYVYYAEMRSGISDWDRSALKTLKMAAS